MRALFLDRPYDHIGAQRTSYDRASAGYAGFRYKRPASWADRVARFAALALVLGALGLLIGGAR